MNSNKDYHGGPAFPYHLNPDGGQIPGMSLRDWFAGQALIGILSNLELTKLALAEGKVKNESAMSEAAYRFADAMLEARK